MQEYTEDEITLLKVFQVRRIKRWMGLTYEILESELKYDLEQDLDLVIESLLNKEIVEKSPHYPRLYILTDKGLDVISQL